MFAAVGTGSFFVESIFRVPGMGRFFVLSMTGRDYPMIMAVVLAYGAFLAVMNLVVDLALRRLRPADPVLTRGDLRAGRRHPPASHADRDTVAAGAPVRGTSLWRDAVRRLRRNRLAMAGGVVVVLLCLIAIFADVLAPLPYTKTNFGRLNEEPSRDYLLGTDQLGRDLLSRMIYGARISMIVGLGAQIVVVLIGVPIGALSGYLGGRVDLFLTRFIDVMYAFPRLLFVILVMSALGAGLTNIFIAIGLTGWVGIARQTRAQVLMHQGEGVRRGRPGPRRRLRPAARPAHPAQRAHPHRGVGDLRHPGGDLHGGGALVHRRRHQPAHAVVGPDGGRRPAIPPLLLAPLRLSVHRHRDYHARRSRSSGTASATPSIPS